jgi:hypothetical protein
MSQRSAQNGRTRTDKSLQTEMISYRPNRAAIASRHDGIWDGCARKLVRRMTRATMRIDLHCFPSSLNASSAGG